MVAEPSDEGLRLFDNAFGVMTNAPSFDYHLTRLSEYMTLTPKNPDNNLTREARLTPASGGYGAIGLPGDWSSASRFVRGVFAREHTLKTDDSVLDFFHIIGTVEVPNGTSQEPDGQPTLSVYTSAIDTAGGIYYYKTYDSFGISSVRLGGAALDGSRAIEHPLSRGVLNEL